MNKYGFLLLISMFLVGCSQSEATPEIPNPVISTTIAMDATATSLPPIEVKATEQPDPTATEVVPVDEKDVCKNPYYPVVNGAEWTYNISNGTSATHAITVADDGMFTITITGKDSVFTIDGQCTEDGITLMNMPGISLTYSGTGGGSTVTTNSVDGITLPDDIQLGDDWSQTFNLTGESSNGELTLSATIEMSYVAIDYETVTVPAGTFHALKVQQSSTTTMNGQSYDSNGFLWYAQGFGTIKSVMDDTYTAELVTYNIP